MSACRRRVKRPRAALVGGEVLSAPYASSVPKDINELNVKLCLNPTRTEVTSRGLDNGVAFEIEFPRCDKPCPPMDWDELVSVPRLYDVRLNTELFHQCYAQDDEGMTISSSSLFRMRNTGSGPSKVGLWDPFTTDVKQIDDISFPHDFMFFVCERKNYIPFINEMRMANPKWGASKAVDLTLEGSYVAAEKVPICYFRYYKWICDGTSTQTFMPPVDELGASVRTAGCTWSL